MQMQALLISTCWFWRTGIPETVTGWHQYPGDTGTLLVSQHAWNSQWSIWCRLPWEQQLAAKMFRDPRLL
eukprot:scaffold2160_cov48-Attheya_sp.AAC.1